MCSQREVKKKDPNFNKGSKSAGNVKGQIQKEKRKERQKKIKQNHKRKRVDGTNLVKRRKSYRGG